MCSGVHEVVSPIFPVSPRLFVSQLAQLILHKASNFSVTFRGVLDRIICVRRVDSGLRVIAMPFGARNVVASENP